MLLGITSCKKKVAYDPSNYDKLAYVKLVTPSPLKVYELKAMVGQEPWNTLGSAIVNGDTLVISATYKGQLFKISLADYTSSNVFLIDQEQNSASLQTADKRYSSIVGSDGKITITSLDQKFNQIKGIFDLTLSSEMGDDTIRIQNGEFTINYLPYAVSWTEKSGASEITADSIWGISKEGKLIEVNALDTTVQRRIQLVFPNNIEDREFLLNTPYDVTKARVFAYYILQGEDSLVATAGTISLKSNASNVVRGEFKNLRFTSKAGKRFSINGTFSSEY